MKKNCFIFFLFQFSFFIYAQSVVTVEDKHFELKELSVKTDYIEVHPEILTEKIYSNPVSVEKISLVFAKGVKKYVKATFNENGKFTTKEISKEKKKEFDKHYEKQDYILFDFTESSLSEKRNLPKPICIFMKNLKNINDGDDFYFLSYDEKNRHMLFKKSNYIYKMVFWNEELDHFMTYDFDDFIKNEGMNSVYKKIPAITEDAQYASFEIEISYRNDDSHWTSGLMLGFIDLEKLQKGEQAFVLTNHIFGKYEYSQYNDYGSFMYNPQKGWAYVFAGPDKKRKQNNTVNILYMSDIFD